jgi:hypothetical protein
MSEALAFRPPRQRGILFHSTMILALGSTSVLAFLVGMNQQSPRNFVLLLILSLLLFAPLPWIVYRIYALIRAHYRLERDGLRLRWGLRAEDIPLPEVEWVRRSEDLAASLPIPPLSWPGAMLGMVNTADLGPVEYMASTARSLVLIATPGRVYAISPEDPQAFLYNFQRTLEMGSLTPLPSSSVLPAAYLTQIWRDRLARIFLMSGAALTVLLFVAVSLIIPGRALASLGFSPAGAPLSPVPSAQLLLLPILGAFMFLVDLATGLFFYRRQQHRVIAYIVWASSVAASLLLGAALLFILRVSP